LEALGAALGDQNGEFGSHLDLKASQNGSQKPKKAILKKALFWAWIFKSLGIGFGRVFKRFLARKIYENCKSGMLLQTSKIELSLERGAYFLEIEGSKTYKNQQKINEKSYVIWILDFGGLLGRFREGFRRPKSWFGGRKPPKRGWKPPKNQYKIKVKKNSEKNEESGARLVSARRMTPCGP